MALRPRALHHICIQTADYRASRAFYCDILGFRVIKETFGFHQREVNAWLALPASNTDAHAVENGVMIEMQTGKVGQPLLPWSAEQSGPVHFALLVDDVLAAYESVVQSGWHHFKRKAGEALYLVETSWLFKVIAPEGTEIEVRDVASL